MDWEAIRDAFIHGLIWLAALYYGPQIIVKGFLSGYYEIKRKNPTIRNENINFNVSIPTLHLLKSFFRNEGALGAAERAELELGARRAMIAEFAAHLLQDEKIARKSSVGNHTFSVTANDFARVAGQYDPKYGVIEAKEQ